MAQFFPLTLEGYRQISSLYFPNFNFYQFAGHPIAEAGYIPVLYPLTWAAFFIAEHLIGNVQTGWDVLSILQIHVNATAVLLLAIGPLSLSPLLGLSAGIGAAYLGIVLHFSGDWFYVSAIVGFTALMSYLILRIFEQPKVITGVTLGAAASVAFYATNIQLLFYAFHFTAGIALLGWMLHRPAAQQLRAVFLSVFSAATVFVLTSGPYFMALLAYSSESLREKSQVTIDMFFWECYSLSKALAYFGWPSGEKAASAFWQTPFVHYVGVVPAVGILLLPLSLRCRGPQRTVLIALGVMSLTAFLLAIGPEGGIGYALYYLPVYNWFRHALKWAPFFQLFSLLLGYVSLQAVLSSRASKTQRRILEGAAVAVTFGFQLLLIARTDNPQRLTDATLPLPAPQQIDRRFRHLPVWEQGQPYTGHVSEFILGNNFASVWRVPTIAGHEPTITRRNLEVAQGHWFPGFYRDLNKIDLPRFAAWSVRFIRVPHSGAEKAWEILRSRFPNVEMRRRGVDRSGKVDVFELPAVKPLVRARGRNTRVTSFSVQSGRVAAHVESKGPGVVLFSWLYRPSLRADAGQTRLDLRPDRDQRVVVEIPEAGEWDIILRDDPLWARLFKWGWLATAAALVTLWIAQSKFWRAALRRRRFSQNGAAGI